jgi:fucose permease
MFTMSNLGGAFMPFLVGLCSDRFHNLRIGLTVPLLAGILMYLLYRFRWKPAVA